MRCFVPLAAVLLAVGHALAQGVLGGNGQPDPAHPDLYAWYAAWQGVNGVGTPIDGAAVTRWNDLSAAGHHLVRVDADPLRRPTWRLASAGTVPAVEFDGNDYLWADAAGEFGTLGGDKTMFFVCRVRSADGGYVCDGTNAAGRNALFTGQTSAPGRWHTYGGGTPPVGPAVAHDAFQIHVVQIGPTQVRHEIEGAQSYAGPGVSTALAGLMLGARYSLSNELVGDVAEVLVYSRALGTAERQAVFGYLRARYPANAPPQSPAAVDVFVGGAGYPAYRIPALKRLTSGVLLAFAEARQSLNDHSQNDIVLRRSLDGGATWLPLQVLHDDGANSLNNPCVVQVEHGVFAGRVLLMYQRYPAGCHVSCVVPGLSGPNVSLSYLMTSDDDGATWSTPIDVTAQVKRATAKTLNSGPGIGIVKRRAPHLGRVVVPFNQLDTAGHWTNYAAYSDDGGLSWSIGALVDDSQTPGSGNEVQMVERSDGSLLLNSRSYGGTRHRKIATSADGGATWSPMAEDAKLIEPEVMASVFRFTDPLDGDRSRVLYAGPNSRNGRVNGVVKLSHDEGQTWSEGRVVYAGGFAYSSLAAADELRLALLYEADGYARIAFAALPVEWLSAGRDCLGNCAHGCTFGTGCPGSGGIVPQLTTLGCATPGSTLLLQLAQGSGGAPAVVALGLDAAPLALPGCTLSIAPLLGTSPIATLVGPGPSGGGQAQWALGLPPGRYDLAFTAQGLVLDLAAAAGVAASAPLALRVF